MVRSLLAALAAAVYLLLGGSAARGAGLEYAPGQVLVKFRESAGPSLRQNTISAVGGTLASTNPVLGYARLSLPANASVPQSVEFLSRQPAVEWAEPNGYYYPLDCEGCPQDPYLREPPDTPNQWGVFQTGLQSLWRNMGGSDESIVIGVVDTGVSSHPDLFGKLLQGYDFAHNDSSASDSGAAGGHGTHVAGIAAAASDTLGIAGVAHCAKILPVRVLDCVDNGCRGDWDDIASGIAWAADNGARVINLSLGGHFDSQAVRAAVLHALAEGAILVAATGNDTLATAAYPARYDEVVGVGSSSVSDAVAVSSNWGPGLDVVAPGVGIWSTVPGGGWGLKSGTSMASPFVAGIAAVVAARNPDMGPLEFEPWIEAHTVDLAGTHDGEGRVDFIELRDVSDGPGYPVVRHDNYAWEWLGKSASAESTATDPADEDGRPNRGGPHDTDGADDGVFPATFVSIPFLPPHIVGGAPSALLATLTTCNPDGPRYGGAPDSMLHFDAWFDWNSDLTLRNDTTEHNVSDFEQNPGTWGASSVQFAIPFMPLDRHMLGNPLMVRSRLAHGASSGLAEATPVPTGEVEDARLINFVEDFDTALYGPGESPYMSLVPGWFLSADPTFPCAHHGSGELAKTGHPSIGAACTGVIEGLSIMSSPVFDLTEYTTATLRYWYCHQIFFCPPGIPDRCRVRVILGGGMPVDLGPIPTGSGVMTVDLTPFVGLPSVRVQFVEETDLDGFLCIDDVTVWSFDGEKVKPVSDLAVSRTAGDPHLDLSWTSPEDNSMNPASDIQSNVYRFRYDTSPILTEADWDAAIPFTVKEGGIPPSAPPGAPEGAAFRMPSALQEYYVAVRGEDEVVNRADLSNSPGDATFPTLGVAVASLNDTAASPGETADLLFRVSNTGTIADLYALQLADTRTWGLDGPLSVALAPGADSTVTVEVTVAFLATPGQVDAVTLTARSLTQTGTQSSGTGNVTADSTDATGVGEGIAGAAFVPRTASVRLAGAHPVRERAAVELALPRPQQVAARIVDVTGRLVRTLADGPFAAGVHDVRWDLRNERGVEVEAGIYFLDLRSADLDRRQRIVVAR